MRHVAPLVLVLGATLNAASSFAAPPPSRAVAARGGHGTAVVGPVHRPVYHRHVGWYGGRYGYGGYPYWRGRWGYPYYGYGWGVGLGYGVGWAMSYPGYYWGAPYYSGYPYGYAATVPALSLNDDIVYVQRPQDDAANAPSQRSDIGYWYYCVAPAGYYPYVEQCTRPWVAVDPQTGSAAR